MGNRHDKYKQTSNQEDSDTEVEYEYRYRRSSRKRRDKSSRYRRSVSKSRQGYYSNKSEDENSMHCSTSDFHCKVCNVYSSGFASWQQHISGKRHANEIKRKEQEELYRNSFEKRKRLERPTYKKPNNKMNKKRKLAEETHEEKDFVGLDYVLVIHKERKSVFQCFLCDTCTMYQNSKQLTDHVLGDEHQRAYVEQHDKGLIKIKRLKSKNPGKGAMEKYIEQMLLNPNRKDNLETRFPDYWGGRSSPQTPPVRRARGYLSSCDKKGSTSTAVKKRTQNIFLRRTLEQVEIHNRRYASKMSSTFVPKRKSSSATPKSVSSPIRSPSIESNASKTSTVFLSDNEVNDPVVSTKTAIPSISELKEILTTNDIFNLVLLKLENIQLSTNEEFDLLNKVVEQSTKLSKVFEQNFNSTVQENIQLSKKQVDLLNEVVEQIKTHGFKEEFNSTVQDLLPVMDNSASSADMDQNPSIIVPD